MTALEPRSCFASASTARVFAGIPPPFRLTLGPVLIFAMSPPKNYEALVPNGNEGQPRQRRVLFSPPQDLPLLGAGFSGYGVVCRAIMRSRDPRVQASRRDRASRSAPACS